MDFRLDDEQLALQDAVRRFCAARFPLDEIPRREGRPIDRAVWRAMGDIGILGVLTPQADGGAGLGAVEAALVLEQLGRQLVSGPAVWSILSAPLIPGVAGGGRIVGGLDAAVVDGDPILVDHAADLDTLVVLRPDGVFACDRTDLPPPVAVTPLDPLTLIGRYSTLSEGGRIGDVGDARRLQRLGTALTAAVLVGVSAAALETARAYALERRQFGVPIGSFQAIKHMLADMYVRTSLARSATFAAAALIDDTDATGPAPGGAGAKLVAGEAAIANARAAVQVLGGMGYTWAMLPHYLLKRAWVLEHAFGTGDSHALAIGSHIGMDVS